MSAFTPGPWMLRKTFQSDRASYQRGVDWLVETVAEDGPESDTVAEIVSVDLTGEANARLIAAAPDLYEAAANLLEFADKTADGMLVSMDLHGAVLNRFRSALSNATETKEGEAK